MKEYWALCQDNLLRFSIKKYGTNNWSKISTLFSFKSKKNCYNRWKNWLDEKIKKSIWAKKEDKLIFFSFNTIFSHQWSILSDFLHRNRLQCIYRIKLLLYFRIKIDQNLIFYKKKKFLKNGPTNKKKKFFLFQKFFTMKLRLLNSFGKKQVKKAKFKPAPKGKKEKILVSQK
mmetsp:Transcript_19592/g.45481  ORF Transcript_19592/g.45481 Transcript_19592/m.45481 type:complete len:173 (+) Transcript_19592:1414-1932(+)